VLRTEPEDRVTVPFCVNLINSATLRGTCDDTGRKYVVLVQESFVPPTGYALCEATELFYNRPCYTTCAGMSCQQLQVNESSVVIDPQTGVCGSGNPGQLGQPQCVPMQ
jgi:hypothetical protein